MRMVYWPMELFPKASCEWKILCMSTDLITHQQTVKPHCAAYNLLKLFTFSPPFCPGESGQEAHFPCLPLIMLKQENFGHLNHYIPFFLPRILYDFGIFYVWKQHNSIFCQMIILYSTNLFLGQPHKLRFRSTETPSKKSSCHIFWQLGEQFSPEIAIEMRKLNCQHLEQEI